MNWNIVLNVLFGAIFLQVNNLAMKEENKETLEQAAEKYCNENYPNESEITKQELRECFIAGTKSALVTTDPSYGQEQMIALG